MSEKIIGHSGHFIDHDDGTATDKRTGLMWMRAALGQRWSGYKCIGQPSRFSFIETKNIVSSVAGYQDWRLPKANELKSLIDSAAGSSPDNSVFSNQLGQDLRFWSTTGQKIDLSTNCDTDPLDESVDPRVYVRLVRGGFEHPISITTNGSGTGAITRSPNAEKYAQGTEITLTATAHEGSKFKCWHGDTSGKTATIGITMDSAKSISAEFSELEAYALNVNFSGTGHGVVNRSSDSETHYRGTSIVLTAQAAIGSTFSGWHGDASGVDDSCIVKMTSAKSVTAQFEKVCVDELGISLEFESAKPASMKSGDAAIIFYFNIRNKGEKQVRVTLPLATYVNRLGEEIEQDVWLSGMVIGAEGSTIRAGAFRKTGLVFLKSRLSSVSKGECLFVTVEQTKPPMTMHFTFRCQYAGLSEFELIKATAVDKHAEEDSENLSAMALIVQRLELLESGLTEALRKLDALHGGRLLPLGDAVVRLAPAQTLPDVLRWLSTQVSVSVADLRTKLLPLDLLPSAVIDDINERALDLTGVVAFEDDGTTVTVQQEVLLEVIAQWQG